MAQFSGMWTLSQVAQAIKSNLWTGLPPTTLEYLVVAGGGGGGDGYGAGAGAGGLLQGITSIATGASITVTVGSGGTGSAAASNNATQGGSSVFGSISTVGGGVGLENGSVFKSIQNGGSGGGGSYASAPGQGTSGQGNAGGVYGGVVNTYTPGGGGAGTIGLQSAGSNSGNGGAGIASAISGTVTTYAGGGGGGTYQTSAGTQGSGGVGGGGSAGTAGGNNAGSSGSSNSGGGGGGASFQSAYAAGGNGGSGIVIVRYKGNTQFFTGGTLSYDSINNYTVHTFYSSGTLAPTTPTPYGILNTLTKSLRFRSSNSAYLSRTPASSGNRKTWTWSGWIKLGSVSINQYLLSNFSTGGVSGFGVQFLTDGTLHIFDYGASSYVYELQTTAVFRDPSAWYHFVIAFDTTQATSSNRVKLYVNNVQQTSFSISSYPTQNYDGYWNNTSLATISRAGGVSTQYLEGYMAEVNFIDGQALTPQSFGTIDSTTGVWTPMTFVGTYGTNGFHLPFTNTTSTTTLGYDTSGNSNNWITSGFSLTAGSTYDSMNDVPTLTSTTASNYAVLNPLYITGSGTVTNGNLTFTQTGAGTFSLYSMMGAPTGKWYMEVTMTTLTGDCYIALNTGTAPTYPAPISNTAYRKDGTIYNGSSFVAYGATYTTGDVIGIAYDITNSTITFYKNNTSQGQLTSIPYGQYNFLQIYTGSSGNIYNVNFGQQPFTYTPPSGYVALNTYNLPTPAIVRGNQYMDATTFTGTGASLTVTNAAGFKPDLVWAKSRGSAQDNWLADSVRGANNILYSNLTNAETDGAGVISSFNSNGFGVTSVFTNNTPYVGWQWQAGQGSNVSNTNGSITSTVSANTTSGFSIVTYTGNNTVGATFGHGLGVIPSFVIIKRRDSTSDWFTGMVTGTNIQRLLLNTTAASSASSPISSFLTSTTVQPWYFDSSGSGFTNVNAATYVAYCFAQIAGFSAFGSYTGNGSTTGPFIYTGFRPKYIMYKSSTRISDWGIVDTSRNPYNSVGGYLSADTSGAEGTYTMLNILSNGWQIIWADSSANSAGETYIYIAFAENPFKYANAR